LKTLKKESISQILRFICVGVIAAIVNLGVVVFIVEVTTIKPLIANIFAFIVALQISYRGHRKFTFSTTRTSHFKTFPKLLFLQLLNLIANEYLFALLLSFHFYYPIALFIVLASMPLFTFLISKYFIFV